MVKDGGALARATSIGPRAATGLEVFADAAGGIPRYGITWRGGNNDRLSTLWREVISIAGLQGHSPKHCRTETFSAATETRCQIEKPGGSICKATK